VFQPVFSLPAICVGGFVAAPGDVVRRIIGSMEIAPVRGRRQACHVTSPAG
jgi:hypothetical protein